MKAALLKNIKQGEFFTLRPLKNPDKEAPLELVWIRGEYDREDKKYECSKFIDVSHFNFWRGDRIVYTDFLF